MTLIGFFIIGVLIGSLPAPADYILFAGVVAIMLVALYTRTSALIQRRKDASP